MEEREFSSPVCYLGLPEMEMKGERPKLCHSCEAAKRAIREILISEGYRSNWDSSTSFERRVIHSDSIPFDITMTENCALCGLFSKVDYFDPEEFAENAASMGVIVKNYFLSKCPESNRPLLSRELELEAGYQQHFYALYLHRSMTIELVSGNQPLRSGMEHTYDHLSSLSNPRRDPEERIGRL